MVVATSHMATFTGMYLVIMGPNGEPTMPPTTSHPMIDHFVNPIRNSSETELASATKNLERITEPIVYLGLLPPAINVDETIVPHPPPPMASRKPAISASGNTFFIFLPAGTFRTALYIITKPKESV